MKIQFIWWQRWPDFAWYYYPRDYAKAYKRPWFYGLYLGFLDIRIWTVDPFKKDSLLKIKKEAPKC